MSLINIISSRIDSNDYCNHVLDDMLEMKDPHIVPISLILHAIWSKNEEYLEKAKRLLDIVLDEFLSNSNIFEHELNFPKVLSFVLASHHLGNDRSEAIERLKNMSSKRSINIDLKRLITGEYNLEDVAQKDEFYDVSKLSDIIGNKDIRYLFDISSSPDHPEFIRDLKYFVIPAAWILFNNSGGELDFVDYVRGHHILKEDQEIILEWDNPLYSKKEPSFKTINVVIKEKDTYVIGNWLSYKWQAPVKLIPEDRSPFFPLSNDTNHFDEIKKQIITQSKRETNQKIDLEKNLEYRIYYNPSKSSVNEKVLKQASEKYNIRISSKPFTHI